MAAARRLRQEATRHLLQTLSMPLEFDSHKVVHVLLRLGLVTLGFLLNFT